MAVSPALERVLGARLAQPGVRKPAVQMGHPLRVASGGAHPRSTGAIKKRSPRLATTLTNQIMAALDAQTVTLPAESTWGKVISALIDDLNRIQAHRTELATDIAEAFLQHPLGQILNTLCGFGDPHRFQNGARLASYAGLAPVNRRSGKSINRTSQHRGGNHRLKNAMFTAAFVATQHDPTAKAYYQRKRSQGKHHNAAVICVARRRCDLILAMLKNQTPYNPQHPTTDLEKR